MLTDPFYSPDVALSGASTGLLSVTGDDYVQMGLSLKAALLTAGWSVVGSGQSVAEQQRSSFYFATTAVPSPPVTPVDMTPEQCTSPVYPLWNQATAAGWLFCSYDSYHSTPTCPGGTNGIKFYQAGLTTQDTADNLASKISELGIWFAEVISYTTEYTLFRLTSLATAFENDMYEIRIGGGDSTSIGGYYILQSQADPDTGAYLTIKIKTQNGTYGHDFYSEAHIGAPGIFVTIAGSGGGTPYSQFIQLGTYSFIGNPWQFALFNGPTDHNPASMILASMPKLDPVHGTTGTSVVIGSYNFDITADYTQLADQLHWHSSLAAGHGGALTQTGYHTAVGTSNYRMPCVPVRGRVNGGTRTRAGQPIAEAAYIAVPASPLTDTEAVMGGKLYDAIVMSAAFSAGSTMEHDGSQYILLSRDVKAGDVQCSLWLRTAAG